MKDIYCNECKTVFIPMLQENIKKTKTGTIVRTYIKCPACGAEYDVSYDSSFGVSTKKRINKITSGINQCKTEKEQLEKQKKIEKLRKKLEREMKRAKHEYYYRERLGEENGRNTEQHQHTDTEQ